MKKPSLAIAPSRLHFNQWELGEFAKYFDIKLVDRPSEVGANDVLFVYAWCWSKVFADVNCRAKFCMLYPGFGFKPMGKMRVMRRKYWPVLQKYTAVFANEGPAWQMLRGYPTGHLVPYSAADQMFRKVRQRESFKRIILVARDDSWKGRNIAEAAMQLMPWDWEIIPKLATNMIPWSTLPAIYQKADGFLCTSTWGPGGIDAKYNQATMEAGLSGCIIFWHDAMRLGNSFETVFPISSDPNEIAKQVKDIVGSINLDKHSSLTAEEFRTKCNAAQAIKARVDIMQGFVT